MIKRERLGSDIFAALAKQIAHFKSDITTSMGLPAPLMGVFNLFQFGSIGEYEQTVAENAGKVYFTKNPMAINYPLYFDKSTSQISVKSTKEIFMERNLYRDDINNLGNPTKIEGDLACFEREVSQIIKKGFLDMDEISITLEEDEMLKIFFAIMGFRSKNTEETFGVRMSACSKNFYSKYQTDRDFADFWKRNPTVITGMTDSGMELEMYSIFPLSPSRVLLLACNGVQGAPKKVAVFSNEVLKKPRLNAERSLITIRAKKIYEHEVRYVDSVLMKEANFGFAFGDKGRVPI